MKEKPVEKKIREYLKKTYNATVHKYHGSIYGERGHADIYGTLPGGRAFYFEIKRPKGGKLTLLQELFLATEYSRGAVIGVVTSVEEVESIMKNERVDKVT